MVVLDYVSSKIRAIVDFPKKGIVFRDITTAAKDAKALQYIVDYLTEQFKDEKSIMLPVLNPVGLFLVHHLRIN